MSGSSYLGEILVFLAASVLVGPFCRQLRISSVLGYLLAGLLIGPHGIGLINNIEGSKLIGHFGVLFLLFTIALELPWQRLRVLKRYVFGLGPLQVILTAIVIVQLCKLTPLAAHDRIVVGVALTLSSTAMVMRLLAETGELAARFGRVSFSVLLFQDLAVVGFLILIPLLAQTATDGSTLAQIMGVATLKGITALVLIGAFGRWVLRPAYRLVASARNPEVFMATTLLLIVSTSLLTFVFGLSMELGAFLAGMLLAETEYRHQVEADIEPFRGLLLGLFFITVGMAVDMRLIVAQGSLIAVIVGSMLFVKASILILLTRCFHLSWASSIRVGLLLAAGGEFGFVLFGTALTAGLLSPSLVQLLNLSIVVSMALTPLLATLGKFFATRLDQEPSQALTAAYRETGDIKDHVIIIGFGVVGQTVGRLLTEQLIPYVAVDHDMNQVEQGRSQGVPTFFGDAKRIEILRALGAARARAAVVAVEKKNASAIIVTMLKRSFPGMEIFVRVRDHEHGERIRKLGAIPVIPETFEPSLQLAASVFKAMGVDHEQVIKTIDTYRRHHIPRTDIPLQMVPEGNKEERTHLNP